jgi:hypothetical protein
MSRLVFSLDRSPPAAKPSLRKNRSDQSVGSVSIGSVAAKPSANLPQEQSLLGTASLHEFALEFAIGLTIIVSVAVALNFWFFR